MTYKVQLTHTPKKKAKIIFEFNTDTNEFTHNETGTMRADLLNTLGNKLSIADLDYHYSTVYDLERWLADYVYVPLKATDKAAINKFKKKAITALNKIIKENKEYTVYSRLLLAEEQSNATPMQAETNDFDFNDDVLSKDFNNEETLVDAKHLNDDFDFDEFNDEPEPKEKVKDEIDLKIEALLIDGAKGLETVFLSLAGLCRLVVEQYNEKPTE